MSLINATLPIQMKVISKNSFNRYTLLLNHKEVSTKSLIELEVGAEYLAELYESKGGVINFKNLYKKPILPRFDEGLEVIVKLLEENDFDFKNFVINSLINTKNANDFKIYKEMLFALSQGIYHIPFIFENKAHLFQLKKSGEFCELFLFFSVFGNVKFIINGEKIRLLTPFFKVASFLQKNSAFEVAQDKNVRAFFEFKKLLDFKG